MRETYGIYVDDECFDMHEYDDGDDTGYDSDDETDDGGRGNRRPLPGGPEFISLMMIYLEAQILDLVLSRNRLE